MLTEDNGSSAEMFGVMIRVVDPQTPPADVYHHLTGAAAINWLHHPAARNPNKAPRSLFPLQAALFLGLLVRREFKDGGIAANVRDSEQLQVGGNLLPLLRASPARSA
ncbi:hypothetical protein N7527_000563 [Penicillium freii]|nr:hypothetical protein N7527_000563 [Penicillium freii]